MTQHHEQRRKQAMARYLADDKIDDICQQMACSKSWLYKWKARYQPGDPTWAEDLSRKPKTLAAKTSDRIEQAVVEIRQSLARNGQSSGAQAIRQALKQRGIGKAMGCAIVLRKLIAGHPATPFDPSAEA